MSEFNAPFQIFRTSIPDGEYSRRADVVEKIHYDELIKKNSELLGLLQRWLDEPYIIDPRKVCLAKETEAVLGCSELGE